jgi:hypothetical protein
LAGAGRDAGLACTGGRAAAGLAGAGLAGLAGRAGDDSRAGAAGAVSGTVPASCRTSGFAALRDRPPSSHARSARNAATSSSRSAVSPRTAML